MAKFVITGFPTYMKISNIFPYTKGIPLKRKQYIKSCIKEFNKNFPNTNINFYPVTRNKVGIPFHLGALGICINNLINEFSSGNFFSVLESLFWGKANLDFVIYINNINKKKASLFSTFMKTKQITDSKELLYGTVKYLISAGSYHYPFLHPNKTKRLALKGDWDKTFETGIFAVRTDCKRTTSSGIFDRQFRNFGTDKFRNFK